MSVSTKYIADICLCDNDNYSIKRITLTMNNKFLKSFMKMSVEDFEKALAIIYKQKLIRLLFFLKV